MVGKHNIWEPFGGEMMTIITGHNYDTRTVERLFFNDLSVDQASSRASTLRALGLKAVAFPALAVDPDNGTSHICLPRMIRRIQSDS